MQKIFSLLAFTLFSVHSLADDQVSPWLLLDNFEHNQLTQWQKADTQNQTKPKIENPQITEIRQEAQQNQINHYLIKKPAQDGVVGNRKALTFSPLPKAIEVGETYTFYLRINVESFPNNHAFGISNLAAEEIKKQAYNAFEPTLRVTDKAESNGYKNDGALMVKIDSEDKYRQYANVQNYQAKRSAKPLQIGSWYQVWFVVNNALVSEGGQTYDVYMQGGEFTNQTLVYKGAKFRMKREQALIYFFATCNTGPHKQAYGNGGLKYDDIYMSKGLNLSLPALKF
ncbi:hypothetical protein [Catenovulum maritimum]|uniref:Polysaccharide lyase family 7 protein n=1 Tax=Catenovulum maritimum TaxID=1513271 RepID=A0A0J8H107_9ALTE|nr:hypothetical protein [Catenovulum maritimum]KMT66703.1 hypothetical protein XM47_00800 [Catenovulum maritimum]